jgi:hypothetical protein
MHNTANPFSYRVVVLLCMLCIVINCEDRGYMPYMPLLPYIC